MKWFVMLALAVILTVTLIPVSAQSDCVVGAQGQTGTVKWFNADKGFGFIMWDGCEDVFVHYSEIAGRGYRSLDAGERVEFGVEEGRKGLQATNVVREQTVADCVVGAQGQTGTVKWFNADKGFGFIMWDGCEDVFVHYSEIAGRGYRSLDAGERVEFGVEEGRKGLQATSVVRVNG